MNLHYALFTLEKYLICIIKPLNHFGSTTENENDAETCEAHEHITAYCETMSEERGHILLLLYKIQKNKLLFAWFPDPQQTQTVIVIINPSHWCFASVCPDGGTRLYVSWNSTLSEGRTVRPAHSFALIVAGLLNRKL